MLTYLTLPVILAYIINCVVGSSYITFNVRLSNIAFSWTHYLFMKAYLMLPFMLTYLKSPVILANAKATIPKVMIWKYWLQMDRCWSKSTKSRNVKNRIEILIRDDTESQCRTNSIFELSIIFFFLGLHHILTLANEYCRTFLFYFSHTCYNVILADSRGLSLTHLPLKWKSCLFLFSPSTDL